MPALTRQRLAQAAFLYYVEGLSQEQVSRQLGVSRSNVSRMLTSAREQKVVRFEIDYPTIRNHSLESAVQARFAATRLSSALVLEVDDDAVGVGAVLAVCQGASEWLSGALRNGQTIGLSWGRTIQTLVDSAHFDGRWDVNVVQLSGEASLDPARSGHDLVRDLAERLGGRYSYFNAPAVTPTREVAAAMARSPLVASALRQARSVDLAILGLGAFNEESSRRFLAEVAEASPEELTEAEAKGAIGQICGRLFDAAGRQVDTALTDRVLSADLPAIRSNPSGAIGAAGSAKTAALASAVVGGLADVIIIDSLLARDLLAYSAGDRVPNSLGVG